MGTFEGHIVPGLALIFLGLWHTINTIKDYHVKGSGKFVSYFWYPFKSSISLMKHFELVIIFFFSIFAVFLQIFDYPFLHLSFKLHNFEHATMFLHLSIFSGFTLFIELTRLSKNLSGVSKLLALSVFSQELLLLHYHSTDHVGLEGHYHFLLQLIVLLSLIASLCATSYPTSFPSALVLAISVVFQGCWFINMAFMLWSPKFIPHGCFAQTGDTEGTVMLGAVTCQTHEAEMTAQALANMMFSWIFGGIIICTCFICLAFAIIYDRRGGKSSEYEQLHSKSGDVSVVITGFNQVES